MRELEQLLALFVATVVLAAGARRVGALALALFVAPILLDAAYDASLRDLKDSWAPVTGLVVFAVGLTTVAATAVLRQLRPPHRILTILEGESLLNDASCAHQSFFLDRCRPLAMALQNKRRCVYRFYKEASWVLIAKPLSRTSMPGSSRTIWSVCCRSVQRISPERWWVIRR